MSVGRTTKPWTLTLDRLTAAPKTDSARAITRSLASSAPAALACHQDPPPTRPTHQRPALAFSALAWILTAALTLACPILTSIANAQQHASENRSRKQTPSYRDNIRRWDRIIKDNVQRVRDHDRLAFRPDGINKGRFTFFPFAENTIRMDDNVFRERLVRKVDLRHDVSSEILMQSNFSRHVIDAAVGAKKSTHMRHSSLDSFNAYVRVFGALHINSAHILYANVYSGRQHEDNLTPSAPVGTRERVRLIRTEAKLALKRDAGRLHALAKIMYRMDNYADVRGFDESIVDQDYKDLRQFEAEIRVGYRFSPGFQLHSEHKVARVILPNASISDITTNANGYRYETLAALEFETSRVIRWRFGVGLTKRTYDDLRIRANQSRQYEARVEWLPIQNLTFRVDGKKGFQDIITDDQENGYNFENIKFEADFEFYRNLIFTITGDYTKYSFVGSTRSEDLFRSGLKLQYFYTKRWFASLGYDYVIRRSNDTARNLRRNIFWGSVRLQY